MTIHFMHTTTALEIRAQGHAADPIIEGGKQDGGGFWDAARIRWTVGG